MLNKISTFFNLLRLALCPRHDLALRKYHVYVRERVLCCIWMEGSVQVCQGHVAQCFSKAMVSLLTWRSVHCCERGVSPR